MTDGFSNSLKIKGAGPPKCFPVFYKLFFPLGLPSAVPLLPPPASFLSLLFLSPQTSVPVTLYPSVPMTLVFPVFP